MKRSDLYLFQEGLEMAQLSGAKFTYAVTKNKRRVASEIKDMESAKAPDEAFLKYQKELEEFNKELADKDANGKPKTKKVKLGLMKFGMQYDIPGLEDIKSPYGKGLEKFKKEYTKEILDQEKKEEEYQEFLKENTKWKPFMIDLDIVPDSINQYIMDRIEFMIKDVEKL